MTSYHSNFEAPLKASHFLPQYWGTWLLLGLLYLFSYCPIKIRDRFAAWLAKRIYHAKFLNKRKKIAFTNLSLCFPEYSQAEKEQLMRDNVRALVQISLSLGELFFRKRDFLLKRVNIIGDQYIKDAVAKDQAIIFLSPHCYGLEYSGIAGLSARGYPLSSMLKDYRNPIYNWFTTRYRTRFSKDSGKGALYHRREGLKPLIKGLRDKTHFYYLPDEDHGRKKSIFCDFYGTQKATLPMVGRLAKLGRAIVIPCFSSYNDKTGQYDAIFHPPLENFPTGDDLSDTQLLNRAIEKAIDENRSQYMWSLKLLKTRPEEGLKIYN